MIVEAAHAASVWRLHMPQVSTMIYSGIGFLMPFARHTVLHACIAQSAMQFVIDHYYCDTSKGVHSNMGGGCVETSSMSWYNACISEQIAAFATRVPFCHIDT